ncbi:histidine kinase [Clostridium tertium]|jgi:transposase|uniref:histidine kinase n=1 Tax=Clostridium tertium TaxID=1559 RepID=UPI001C1E5758|nr:histidine kinase [Clostridium tertium]MBU6134907.1 histidine kinase [Clostridium tertium]MDB1955915.1 histidine kinase [Clostridium tertium]MDB1960507.1 histidine kinase [Clostridium tertium]MDB1964231.1 histidine kinase [Clostridium tertium]MDB1966354.1 histidine kinase [Clostridium tertium]
MEDFKLLSVKELAKRWDKDESTIRRYINDRILTPCSGVPGNMFHPKYIAELEGVELEKFSPLEKRRLEKENEEFRTKYENIKKILCNILVESSKVITL